jgi:hypothetical protein
LGVSLVALLATSTSRRRRMLKALWWSAPLPICTATSGTTIPTGTMSTSASGSAAEYVSVLHHPVRLCINNLLVSIIYIIFMLSSHKHIHNVTNLLIITIF